MTLFLQARLSLPYNWTPEHKTPLSLYQGKDEYILRKLTYFYRRIIYEGKRQTDVKMENDALFYETIEKYAIQ